MVADFTQLENLLKNKVVMIHGIPRLTPRIVHDQNKCQADLKRISEEGSVNMKTMNDIAKTPSKQIAGLEPTSAHSSGQNNHIRFASSADWEEMADIYNEAIHSGRSTMDLIPVDANYFRKLADGFSPRECLLVAEHPTYISAWGIVKQYSDRPGYALACETSVYVTENFHGHGVGTALQSAVIQKAWGYGYRHLVAKILAVNETSVRFHHHFDYQIAGIQKKIGFLNGIWHDIIIMQRILTDAQPEESTS